MERHASALDMIRQMETPTITPAQAAQVLGCNPHWIRLMAREKPNQLGFPVTVIKSRTKIPRIPFIRYIEGITA